MLNRIGWNFTIADWIVVIEYKKPSLTLSGNINIELIFSLIDFPFQMAKFKHKFLYILIY